MLLTSCDRVMLAEYFDPAMLYHMLGSFARAGSSNFEITVVAGSKEVAKQLSETIKVCSAALGVSISPAHIAYKTGSLDAYLREAGALVRRRAHTPDKADLLRFDYIEYNGGLSIVGGSGSGDGDGNVGSSGQQQQRAEGRLMKQLRGLDLLLRVGGAVGLTYFAQNQHLQNLRAMLRSRDLTRFRPFSLEPGRLVQQYLRAHGKTSLLEDRQLMLMLGAEPIERMYPPQRTQELVAPVQWRAFTQQEVLQLLEGKEEGEGDGLGWGVISWVPTAYSQPYAELEQHEVQGAFWALGLPQQELLHYFMGNFRYALYVGKGYNSSSGGIGNGGDDGESTRVGRPWLNTDLFVPNEERQRPQLPSVPSPDANGASDILHWGAAEAALRVRVSAADIIVQDRFGTLSASFAGVASRAQAGQAVQPGPVSLAFAHYDLQGAVRAPFLLLPDVAPCLALLSSGVSLQALHQANVAGVLQRLRLQQQHHQQQQQQHHHQQQQLSPKEERRLQTELLSVLRYFEKLNAVVFLSSRGPINAASTVGLDRLLATAAWSQGQSRTTQAAPSSAPAPKGQQQRQQRQTLGAGSGLRVSSTAIPAEPESEPRPRSGAPIASPQAWPAGTPNSAAPASHVTASRSASRDQQEQGHNQGHEQGAGGRAVRLSRREREVRMRALGFDENLIRDALEDEDYDDEEEDDASYDEYGDYTEVGGGSAEVKPEAGVGAGAGGRAELSTPLSEPTPTSTASRGGGSSGRSSSSSSRSDDGLQFMHSGVRARKKLSGLVRMLVEQEVDLQGGDDLIDLLLDGEEEAEGEEEEEVDTVGFVGADWLGGADFLSSRRSDVTRSSAAASGAERGATGSGHRGSLNLLKAKQDMFVGGLAEHASSAAAAVRTSTGVSISARVTAAAAAATTPGAAATITPLRLGEG